MSTVRSSKFAEAVRSVKRIASGAGSWLALGLFVGTLTLVFALHIYIEAKRRDLNGARQALEIALQEKGIRNAQANRAVAVQNLLAAASSAGLDYSSWDERRFNIKQAVMPRDKAGKLLAEIRRSKSSVFGAEQFEVSVRGTEQSLFSTEVKGSELLVTLRGSLLFSRPN